MILFWKRRSDLADSHLKGMYFTHMLVGGERYEIGSGPGKYSAGWFNAPNKVQARAVELIKRARADSPAKA